jgi:thiol-disulfide isomerase/thioredoxin
MKNLLLALLLSAFLLISIVHAQEVGYSDKIEEAIKNCVNCNVCPDGKEIENGKICFYLFWGQGCPHCAEEKSFLEELKTKYKNLEVYEFEVYYNSKNAEIWKEVCAKYNVQPIGVPMSFIGDKAFIGFAERGSFNNSSQTFSKIETSNLVSQTFLIVAVVVFILLAILLAFSRKFKIKVKVKI